MEILKLIFDNAATNFLLLLIVKAMIIFFQIFKNFEFKRPYTYNGYQLGLEFMIMMILLYADKVELVSKELNHFGGIVLIGFFIGIAVPRLGTKLVMNKNGLIFPMCKHTHKTSLDSRYFQYCMEKN